MNLFGQTVSHTDLGGRVYTYTYNLAGWLTGQSSTAGQSIGYEYYANGYIKKTVDNATGAWTEYGYDKVGNRTYEAYSRMVGGLGGNRVYEQNAKISYDELNRVKFIDDLRADIRYEYDAQSNRRRVYSIYQDGVYGYESTQEYWYTYDSMNRFLVTRGKLSAARPTTETGTATILATGVDGVKVAYDKAGQRTQAIYGLDGHREDYTYTADGLVENTFISADAATQGTAPRAVRTNDLMGRVVAYTEYDAVNTNTVTRSRTTTFDKDNRQTGQTETYKGTTSTTVNTLLADGTLSKVVTTGGTTTTLNYAYEWWDSAKQSRITEQAYNPALGMNNNLWKPGVSHYTYDVNGHLLGAIDEQLNKSFTYVNNAQGQVMLREQRDAGTLKQTHRYYYAEGKAVGDVGNDGDTNVDYASQLAETSGTGNTYTDRQNAYKNWRPVSSADFDQNYQAITASYPGTAPDSYVVQAGDSLYSIAASQWGDASLWYLIAEANGLSGASSLTAGQTLSIPNKVTNVHNSSSTSGVYDAGKTMGDTSPTIPDAPPPPRQDKGCGALAMIIVIVVAAVVTGGVGMALAGAATTTVGTMAAWAAAGAVGSIASQGVAMAMGVQQDFSWKAVGVSALGAAVTAGLGGAPSSGGAGATATGASQSTFLGLNGWQAAAARAASASVITQGVGSVLGISSFSWRAVAASAAGAGASSALGQTDWMKSLKSMDSIAAGTVTGLANGGVQAGIFETKPNWGSIAAQSFGGAVGDSIVGSAVKADADRKSVRDENSDFSLSGARLGQSSRSGLRLGTGDAGDSVAAYDSEGGRAWAADVAARRSGASGAMANFDAAAGRVWAQEDAETTSRAQAANAGVAVAALPADQVGALRNTGAKPSPARAAAANSASSGSVLKSAADEFAAKAVQAYNGGDKARGDRYLGYASQYYSAAGDAQQLVKNLSAAEPKFQLPPAAVGSPARELAFEVKLGGAAYFVLGGNFELTANVNLSRPLASGITEFEAGLGLGVGYKAKSGFEWLKAPEPGAAAPIWSGYSDGGQATGTGAVSYTKLSVEGAVPFLTLTGLEMRVGVQSPLTGVPVTDKNFGGFYEVKLMEAKASPFINFGASAKWDFFNTSYKRSSSGRQ